MNHTLPSGKGKCNTIYTVSSEQHRQINMKHTNKHETQKTTNMLLIDEYTLNVILKCNKVCLNLT